MKLTFKDLKVGDLFSTPSLPDRVLKKVKGHGGNCCNPPHNCVVDGKKLLVKKSDEVTLVETANEGK